MRNSYFWLESKNRSSFLWQHRNNRKSYVSLRVLNFHSQLSCRQMQYTILKLIAHTLQRSSKFSSIYQNIFANHNIRNLLKNCLLLKVDHVLCLKALCSWHFLCVLCILQSKGFKMMYWLTCLPSWLRILRAPCLPRYAKNLT